MKRNKGFTLIELLAIIVILAIIAIIATAVIPSLIDEARKSIAINTAYGYIKSIDYHNSMSQLDGTKYALITETDVSKINSIVDLKGTKPTSGTVTIQDGEVTEATLLINEYIVKYDGTKATVIGKQGPIVYEAYSVGDDVTLKDGTTWVVVKDSTSKESEVKIMSTLNIHKDLANKPALTGADLFVSKSSSYSNYVMPYNTTMSNDWASSSANSYLTNVVKPRLEASLQASLEEQVTITDITIWGEEELTDLGCTLTKSRNGYSSVSCSRDTAWYSKVFENTNSWTKLGETNTTWRLWVIYSGGGIVIRDYNHTDSGFGIRPIITITKSAI